jgi:hypothetical protein
MAATTRPGLPAEKQNRLWERTMLLRREDATEIYGGIEMKMPSEWLIIGVIILIVDRAFILSGGKCH